MKKIYIILLIALLVRLIHISYTVIGWHSWRQSDTAAIAKNFYENGYNILYPQIDWRGNTEGYVESEFHIYPFIVSLLYGIFGVHESLGRITSVIFSLLTILGLYILFKKYLGENIALWSAFIYAIIPLNIFYGRAFMPESAMLMFSVFGIYFYTEWLDNYKWKDFILTLIFISLAILIKLTSLYLGFLMFFLIFQKNGIKFLFNWKAILLGTLILIPVAGWYYHAHILYLKTNLTFAIWEFSGDKWANLKILTDIDFYHGVFLRNIAERHLTYPGFIFFIFGLFIKRKNKNEFIFDFWLISVLIYFFVVARGVNIHEYYQLPFILPAVAFVGKSIDKIVTGIKDINIPLNKKIIFYISVLLMILIPVLSTLRIINFYRSENNDNPIFSNAEEIQKSTKKEDLIITVCDGNPVYLYIYDRKGWVLTPDRMNYDSVFELKKTGAKCLTGALSIINTPERKMNLDILKEKFGNYKITKDYFEIYLLN